MICPECHSTTRPNYRGACVSCLRRELDRLAALNTAYWREIGDWRKTCGSFDCNRGGGWCTTPVDAAYRMPQSDATDAARRAAGEDQ